MARGQIRNVYLLSLLDEPEDVLWVLWTKPLPSHSPTRPTQPHPPTHPTSITRRCSLGMVDKAPTQSFTFDNARVRVVARKTIHFHN